ncbi:MAG: NTP transferase domain-containing protein, partial [Rhizobiales bacterium]|nr:NTP transferase domain-containing protein [Rhizobacter sp.]
MTFIVLVPARLASTRLPNKPLADIAGRPMIAHVVERALAAELGPVAVATDDRRIVEALGSS